VHTHDPVYVCMVTFITTKIINKVIDWRVTTEVEYLGLDVAQHGEEAYS